MKFLFRWHLFVFRLLVVCVVIVLGACSTQPVPSDDKGAIALPFVEQQAWKPMHLPGKRKTIFSRGFHDGREAIEASASSSASMFRQAIRLNPQDLGVVKFSWVTRKLIDSADMAERDREDAVVRVILSFEGDRAKFSAKNKMLSELSLVLTGEELPYATLMYVWCNKRAAGDVITNPRTYRIRKVVVESGKTNLGRWLDYERDIRADFIKAFGEEPGALTGIALMTDTDNTQTKATAWYGPVSLHPRQTSVAR